MSVPLAELLRPKEIKDFVGQDHLLSDGRPLRLAIEKNKMHSMILWGPPGVGKTTLARLLSDSSSFEFVSMSAVLSGIKEIRDIIYNAEKSKNKGIDTVLFVDEVHRFNKSQQDVFLPYIEEGLFYFVGATTENPAFEINSALLSRLKVYVMKPLNFDDLQKILLRALDFLNKDLSPKSINLSQDVCVNLISFSDGDGRKLINYLDILFEHALASNVYEIDHNWFVNNFSKDLNVFDKRGDAFYDQMSALHKSMRGSNPDAALYWFQRMIDGGVDPSYLIRRLLRFATEDIGLADPRAIALSMSCADTYERLGSPEGELALANAIVYMSCAAKSNSVYNAYKSSMQYVKKHGSNPVPLHLRNASTMFEKKLGYGRDYRYVHNEPLGYVPLEQYFPDGLDAVFYKPTEFGLEAKIKQKLVFLKNLDKQEKNKS
ncbi:replication-associated recombination protein A [Candidatus Kinetoplastidibacterium desouzai]|nr:replication-associated recombination protein A [Candidatus Kinetoplastibacterium desouzaii]